MSSGIFRTGRNAATGRFPVGASGTGAKGGKQISNGGRRPLLRRNKRWYDMGQEFGGAHGTTARARTAAAPRRGARHEGPRDRLPDAEKTGGG
ncbi:hypothetical protein GCM10009605_17350 [Nocardiopsis composta]